MLGPIFAREWLTVPRRGRHYLIRTLYLGLLWILALTAWQATVGWEEPATLGDNARFGQLLFQILAYVQLILLLFFSALSGASAITYEKDRRTLILLLMTDLRNYEIVLGKLFGSLLQIVLFFLGTIPIFLLAVLLGGVSPNQGLQASLILLMTSLAAGALGTTVALWRDKTFQALALTVLFLVLYFCVVFAIGFLPALLESFAITSSRIDAEVATRWQTWLEPFSALNYVLFPPANAAVLSPAYAYAVAMLVLSVFLCGLSILRLRAWNPKGEPIIRREGPGEDEEEKDRVSAHAAPGALRDVWANPILWREMRTRAYGTRPILVKFAYFVVVVLVAWYSLRPTEGASWLAAQGIVPIGILSLLLVSAQAVTAVTSERDLGSLDLLLVTDLSPKEFIFGKLGGILYNCKEYLLPPAILAGIFAWRGLLATPPLDYPEMLNGKNFEAFVFVTLGILVLFAFTITLGVHVALRNKSSRVAIVNTLGTVFFLSVGTIICIYLILINGRFEYQWLSFSGFIFAGVGGLWWVLSADRPSNALNVASWLCPFAVFYSVTNILIGKPGQAESTDPLTPFLVVGGAFGFTVAAMLVPLLSEFDVALGRTAAVEE